MCICMYLNIYIYMFVCIFMFACNFANSPVHYVQKKNVSFKCFGDLQSYTFLESLEPTDPEK